MLTIELTGKLADQGEIQRLELVKPAGLGNPKRGGDGGKKMF